MSIHAVEKIFWEFGNNPTRIETFRANPEHYLERYNLTAVEREMVARIDLKALADAGVSTLLTLMVWPLINGPEGMPEEYLAHMRGDPLPGSPDV
jgi:hypothetical protein